MKNCRQKKIDHFLIDSVDIMTSKDVGDDRYRFSISLNHFETLYAEAGDLFSAIDPNYQHPFTEIACFIAAKKMEKRLQSHLLLCLSYDNFLFRYGNIILITKRYMPRSLLTLILQKGESNILSCREENEDVKEKFLNSIREESQSRDFF